MSATSTMFIAHRGESFDAPENTMDAINLAWRRGAKAVEVDVHLSKDNKVVVIHDYNTKRFAGVSKKVKNQTLDELKKLDVGSWKDINWNGEQIPVLKEVLDSVPDGKKLIIEIKCAVAIIPFLKADLERSNLKTGQIELIGFDLKTIAQAKSEMPIYKALWLLDLDYIWINRIIKTSIAKAISNAKKYKLDGLNVWAGKMLDQKMIQKVHNSGLHLYCWTVNDVAKATDLVNWGIEGITTDGAQWLTSHLLENH